MSLALLSDDNIRRYGEYEALAFEGRRITNMDQHRAASRVAHALVRLGVQPGDRVVVMLPNCPEVMVRPNLLGGCGPTAMSIRRS